MVNNNNVICYAQAPFWEGKSYGKTIKSMTIKNQKNFSYVKILLEITGLLILSIIFHFLFSKYGFNPTDDGNIIAHSKRLLLGQIPHLDFISIRPVGSALFHTPEVFFFKDHLYLYSRFIVWLQLVIISYLWIGFISKLLGVKIKFVGTWAMIIVSTMLCVHTFPIMAWATIDGIFFSTLGLYCIYKDQNVLKYFGYFLLGYAYLCKQSFLFFPFAVLLILGDWRDIKKVIAAILPGLLYITAIAISGGLNNFITQLTDGGTALLLIKITYGYLLNNLVLLGFVISFTLITLHRQIDQFSNSTKSNIVPIRLLVFFLYLLGALFVFRFLLLSNYHALGWILFGMNVGILIGNLYGRGNKNTAIFYFILILLGWSASLSSGYSQPTLVNGLLFSGVLLYLLRYLQTQSLTINFTAPILKPMTMLGIGLLIFGLVFNEYLLTAIFSKDGFIATSNRLAIWLFDVICVVFGLALIFANRLLTNRSFNLEIFIPLGFIALAILIAPTFHYSRLNKIYRDQRASKLTYDLAGVLPGGNGIYTNENTHNVLVDLGSAIKKIEGFKYAIVPDIAGYWPAAKQANPLPADWIQKIEVPYGQPLENMKSDMKKFVLKGEKIILQKFQAHSLANGFEPITDYDYQPIVPFVKENFKKVDETEYYEIYGASK